MAEEVLAAVVVQATMEVVANSGGAGNGRGTGKARHARGTGNGRSTGKWQWQRYWQ